MNSFRYPFNFHLSSTISLITYVFDYTSLLSEMPNTFAFQPTKEPSITTRAIHPYNQIIQKPHTPIYVYMTELTSHWPSGLPLAMRARAIQCIKRGGSGTRAFHGGRHTASNIPPIGRGCGVREREVAAAGGMRATCPKRTPRGASKTNIGGAEEEDWIVPHWPYCEIFDEGSWKWGARAMVQCGVVIIVVVVRVGQVS